MAFDDGIKTVSGSIAHTDDAAAKVPFVSVKCWIKPTLSGVSSVTETQTGRNLLPMVNYDGGVYNPDVGRQLTLTVSQTQFEKTGNIYSVSTTATWKTFTVLMPIFSGVSLWEKWTLSANDGQIGSSRAYLDEDYKVITRTPSNSNPIVTSHQMQPPSNAKYFCITFTNRGTAVQTLEITEPMIEIGSSASAWEEYSCTQYTASLGRTIYGGQAGIVNGTGTEGYGRIIFDGSNDEFWQKHGSIASWFYIDNAITDGYVNSTENDFMICNLGTQAKYASVAQLSNGQFAFGLPSPTTYRFVFKNTDFTEVADFKAWLSNNNMQVVYKLATPTDFTFTPITPTPETVGKVNNVYCNTGDTEVTYYDNAHGFSEVTVNKTGKNLLENNIEDGSTGGISYSKNADGSISCVGTVSNVNATRLINTVTLPIGNYILSGADSSINLRAVLYDGTGTAVTNRNDTGNGVTISVDSTIAYIEFRIKARTASEVVNTIISPMLAVGSSVLPYEPYEVVSKTAYLHKVIYGGTADVIRGTCEPKNLLDDNKRVFTARNIIFGRDSGGRDDFCLKLKAGTYTFSVTTADGTYTNLYLKNSDTKESISGFPAYAASSKSFTLTEDTNCAVFVYKSDYTSVSDITSAQIEKGSSASEYVPHFEPFSFPPISMSTDEGENTLFANEGASAITYRKETD